MNKNEKANKRGVFWIVDDELLAVPYDEEAAEGLSKNRTNYNHRLLWPKARKKGYERAYDYYPRGRVEYTSYGRPVIFMGMSVEPRFVPEIKKAFEIEEEPLINRDGSEHYMSYMEREEEDRKRRAKLRRYRRDGLL